MIDEPIFVVYDIRGVYLDRLNEDVATQHLSQGCVIGHILICVRLRVWCLQKRCITPDVVVVAVP